MAAACAVVAWGLKTIAIAVAGGLDRSVLEGPLYLVGLLAIVVAFAAIGVSAARGRSLTLRVFAGVLGVVVGLVFSWAVEAAVGAVSPQSAGWVWEEAALWIISLLTLVVSVLLGTRQRHRLAARRSSSL